MDNSRIGKKYNPATFSPLAVRHAILEPLRYLFSKVPPESLRYSNDPDETKIVIGTKGDANQDTPVQLKPRIILSVGGYAFNRSGLTDNLAHSAPANVSGGKLDRQHMLIVNGTSTILVEASEEGVSLLIADMVSNFVTWSAPHVCDSFGFKNFGFPLSVSNCEQDTEDTEKYRVTIGIPWMFESSWSVNEDALNLKGFFLDLSQS